MKRAFPWLFITFAGAFVLFLCVQIAVLVPGVRISLSQYEHTQQAELERIARGILINPQSGVDETLRYSNPFFVFSADGNLLYTNRGKGRAIPMEDLVAVKYNGAIIGHYYAGEMRFLDNEANRIFLTSLLILASVSLLASIVIGMLVALFASRRISKPLRALQTDIHAIESRKRVDARQFAITELSEISSSVESLSSILADEERYKRQWMQDIAHDLRTPVSGLRSQLEGMRDGVLEADTARFDRNLVEIERLEGMVEGIATLYNVENVRELKVESFAAQTFIDEILSSYEVAKTKKQLTVTTDVQVVKITGDKALLHRGVNNIVANAFAYTPAGGEIVITVSSKSGVAIAVSDTGPGIPDDQIDRIFNRFYRGEYARNTTGTGLGLNIARAIVERHDGTLVASNCDSGGAVFTITLPEDATRQ